jgi:hypothetical protein
VVRRFLRLVRPLLINQQEVLPGLVLRNVEIAVDVDRLNHVWEEGGLALGRLHGLSVTVKTLK